MLTYSIIIPHKNIPKLLQRCLDSIPRRPDLEVIVVDDNSDPEIVDFDHFPGLKRPDTTVIFDKSDKGAGRARNIGLEHAQGKWLLFADADDFYTYCLNDVLDEYIDCKADIVLFKASCVDNDYYTNADRTDYINGYVQKYFEDPKAGEMALRYQVPIPWAKLVRRTMVEQYQIRFQETKIWNDVKFSYLTGFYAKTIVADQRAVYCVSKRADSITYTMDDDKIVDCIKVAAEKERFCIVHHIPFNGLGLAIGYMITLKELEKWSLFDKCMDVFDEFGFSKNTIEKKISDELQSRKKVQRQQLINIIIGKIRKLGGKILRSCLQILIK